MSDAPAHQDPCGVCQGIVPVKITVRNEILEALRRCPVEHCQQSTDPRARPRSRCGGFDEDESQYRIRQSMLRVTGNRLVDYFFCRDAIIIVTKKPQRVRCEQ